MSSDASGVPVIEGSLELKVFGGYRKDIEHLYHPFMYSPVY